MVTMTTFPVPTEAEIQHVVELVVTTVQPLRIVLFGSAARDELREGSDLDMMVVMPAGVARQGVARQLYSALTEHGVGLPVEFHVTTSALIEQGKDDVGYLYYDVVREGPEVYAA